MMSQQRRGRRYLLTIVLLVAVSAPLLAPPSAPLPTVIEPPTVAAQTSAPVGPQPGDVFRQFQDDANFRHTSVCNSSSANCGTIPSEQQRQARNVDLANAVRAEAVFEYWGGHLASTQQEFNVNGGPWTPYPDIQGIPPDTLPTCYFRALTNAIAPLPLSGFGGVRPPGSTGNNVTVTYRYRIGPQRSLPQCASGTNFYWGNMWIYEVTTRIYYSSSVTRPDGAIISPANGGVITENLSANQRPLITVRAQAPSGRTIARVDLIGNYLDYDWDGDGVLREWHYALRHGVWERTIGTRTSPSRGTATNGEYDFRWDTEWVPDQDQPIQLMARITDNTGVSYMTPAVTVTFNRVGRSVRMYTTWSDYYGRRVFGPPRNFGFNQYSQPRIGKTAFISVPDPLTNATRARFMLYSWSARSSVESSTTVAVNRRSIWPSTAFGIYHDYSFDAVVFNDPRAFLNQGDNILRIWSNRTDHALEVLWPGPALFVEYSAPPETPPLVANDTLLSTQEDQPLSITLPVSNDARAALQYTILTPPTRGVLRGIAPNLTYIPDPNANGSDSFVFRVDDQYGRSATATVSINVQAVNDPPEILLGEGALLNPGDVFTRTGVIRDPDASGLTATVDYGDGRGVQPLSLNPDGSFLLSYRYSNGGRFPLTISASDGTQTSVATATITVLTPGTPPPPGNWHLTGWRYRIPLEARSGAYPRVDHVAEFDINFTAALSQAGGSGALLRDSIRVVEVDAAGNLVDRNVVYQFDPVSAYNPTTNARGTLLVLLRGRTEANVTRRFFVYFETQGRFAPPSFTPLTRVVTPTLTYQRDLAAVIETRGSDGERNATFYYSLNGGALISMFDRSDTDWISYNPAADSAGEYRGIPNVGPVFHPGYYNVFPIPDTTATGWLQGNELGTNQRSTTTIEQEGTLRTVLRSVSSNRQWEAVWEFFPNSVRMTIIPRPPRGASPFLYWWLYEGTPGGTLNEGDRWVRSDGLSGIAVDPSFSYNERFHADINGPEWVYFRAGEPSQGGRALWLAHHDDADTTIDMYRYQNNSSGWENGMTVFGFGRREWTNDTPPAQTLRQELQGQRRFSLGFVESAPASFNSAFGPEIEGRYRDLAVTVGRGERLLPNLAPWAPGETYFTRPGQTLRVAAPGVRANDSDGDGDPIQVTLTSRPLSGTLTFNSDGSFIYVPNEGFIGADSFTYTASDGRLSAPPTTVIIRVAPNQPPTAQPSGWTTTNRQTLTVPAPGVLTGASDPDGDTLTATLVLSPTNGTLTLNPDGSFTYVPQRSFVGVDTFQIAAFDGEDQSAPVEVRITVQKGNRPPTAQPSGWTTTNRQTLTVPAPGVLTGASDPDGELLTAVLISQPANGTLTLNPDGSFTYVPQRSFVGVDTFQIAAFDGEDQSAPVEVRITVQKGNRPPTAQPSEWTTTNRQTLTVPAPGVLTGASDPDGEPLTATLVLPPTNGSLTLNPNGSFTYTPRDSFIGVDTFQIAAFDGEDRSAPVEVRITVTPAPGSTPSYQVFLPLVQR
ncbi:MAG: Ig-like domain-containing protein [Roseiflexus sp.]|nr:Ig-like domain-containing protein [Roseiflexus sp.]